jgi:hypothetical protein
MTFQFNLKGNRYGAIAALAMTLLSVSVSASAQEAPIVGTWILTGAEKLLPDGKRVSDYGPNPHGLVIFTAEGYYSLQIYRAERSRFASGQLKGDELSWKVAARPDGSVPITILRRVKCRDCMTATRCV